MPMLDIFNDDAFSVTSLTAALNKIDHVPGRAGALAFAGVGQGISTLTATIEERDQALSLIDVSTRGAPAPQETRDKATANAVTIPHVKLEDTIGAHSIQNVRAFGSESELVGPQTIVNQQLMKMAGRHDLTLEHMRLGALRGTVLNASGGTILNLFTFFNVSQESEVDFALGTAGTDVRGKCADVIRKMKRNAKTVIPSGARVHALCSDEFFDALISHANVKGVYDGWAAAERRLGESYVHGIFEFGGIFFENYQGTDDNSTVAIATDKAHFFWSNVPGMYAEYYAPADFMETVNTIGLPRYAKAAPDPFFNQYVKLHTQQNPLPMCLRPKTLIKAKRA
jgi:hypothetical protein